MKKWWQYMANTHLIYHFVPVSSLCRKTGHQSVHQLTYFSVKI